MIEQLERSKLSITYRNFNICPHCVCQGRESLLSRLCEGGPMISRSDGSTFHLFLADQPLPYPVEVDSPATELVSICFWYSHVKYGLETLTSVVVLQDTEWEFGCFFREIEYVADLLSEKLQKSSKLATLYRFVDNKLCEAMY